MVAYQCTIIAVKGSIWYETFVLPAWSVTLYKAQPSPTYTLEMPEGQPVLNHKISIGSIDQIDDYPITHTCLYLP